MIQYTEPFLPPLEEYESYLQDIWARNWLTNNGPLVLELEQALREYLDVENFSYVANGTLALQIAIQALDLNGKVITTPFSYVATTSSLVWEGCQPIFVDIDPDTLNLDPQKIENAITPDTTGIVATHIFGNPCDIDGIAEVANRYNLKVIYDGAQGFGSQYKKQTIFSYGDISIASFHATKLYQAVEGGAVITRNKTLAERVNYMRNFGHDGPGQFNGVGINAKNSEFHAAMGLCNLKYIDELLSVRKRQCSIYDKLLENLEAKKPKVLPNAEQNHSYYPLIFDSEKVLHAVINALETEAIYPRRYFYPSLNQLEYVNKQTLPVAEDIASRILCLPLYHSLEEEEQVRIAKLILKAADDSK